MLNDLMKIFIEEKVAVSVLTQEAYNDFIKLCDEYGLLWSGGCKASDHDHFDTYGKKTCLTYRYEGEWGIAEGLQYCDSDFYESEGYKIIEFN